MVRLINANTGSEMWVHESRLAEYLARGHRIADKAAESAPPAGVSKSDTPPKPRKKAVKPKE